MNYAQANNILCDAEGKHLKLADFGIATSCGELVGKDVVRDGRGSAGEYNNKHSHSAELAGTKHADFTVDQFAVIQLLIYVLYRHESDASIRSQAVAKGEFFPQVAREGVSDSEWGRDLQDFEVLANRCNYKSREVVSVDALAGVFTSLLNRLNGNTA